ncbi:MAG TPA: DUF3343 domain-containing protein [Candidatus Omnitrophota bacterium]|nr:DUF3343 domain-containing protein [Candidatus Omnitrophota bacterium]HRZ14392.1 DUF3343 domain-containing protein [Candidatus Omnitrophota bacterium]
MFIQWLKRLMRPAFAAPRGVLLYGTVQEVIKTHKFLETEGFQVRLIAPPPEFRVGCDLAIEFNLLEQETVEALIRQRGFIPARTVSTREMLPDVLKRTLIVELDGYLMARAGNMKITMDKTTHSIVNISGGGCPDIPYVAGRLCRCKIEEAADPIALGNSLCTYLLQIAFDALKQKAAIPC